MKTILLTFIFTLLILSQAFVFDGVIDNRNVVNKTRNIENKFNKIEVSQGIKVILTQGNFNGLNFEADENLHELLVTEVKDNVLKISFNKNVGQKKTSNIYFSINDLESIVTNSGAAVRSETNFKLTNIKINASSGSHIYFKLDANEIQVEESSGSNIELAGTCNNLTVNSSSGSNFRANNLIAKNLVVSASSGASISVYASESIKANASSGASINCKGNPKIRDRSKSSGASINFK